jgi:ubiquinone biosynthesis protein
MWETAEPYVGEWLRDELGPEAAIAERLLQLLRTLAALPDLIRRIDARFPLPGAAPPPPPLPEIEIVRIGGGWPYVVIALAAAVIGAVVMLGVLQAM